MDTIERRHGFRQTATLITMFAHFFGVIAIILMLIWLLHFRGGLGYDSPNPDLVFNCHPFFMLFGFVFFAGEAMMAFKTVRGEKIVKKMVHMSLNLIAICMGIAGINAAFKFHHMANFQDMYSLHSWIGMATFCIFGLQWLGGLLTFLLPGANERTKARILPWHISGGRALLLMIICTTLTGLLEKATFLKLNGNNETRLVNFIGLFVLFFGIFVDISIAFARFMHIDHN